MEISGCHVVVVGLGRSGIAAANLCLRRGAKVTATDLRTIESLGQPVATIEQEGGTLVLGDHGRVAWDTTDLVVVSPGVPTFPALETAERSGVEIISELELASRFISAPIALVGGTNGKSTVTSWIGEMLSSGSRRVFVGGNLGMPPAEAVDRPFDLFVLEISSFQAERIPSLHARAATLLNVTDDHLDRYADFQAYANAKGNMFMAMTGSDVAVVPANDAVCHRQACRGAGRLVTFGKGGDVRVEGEWLMDSAHGGKYPLAAIALPGAHNLLNACASIAIASDLGASEDEIRRALGSFRGLGHRTAFAGEIRGVRFYDDSKGTNVGASVAALQGLGEVRAVLIAGGRDKLGTYAPLVDALRTKGRALVVIGEAADRISEAATGVLPVVKAFSMQEAVRTAFCLARAGDAVLLSPACSSFDMFSSYAERGDVFCTEVAGLLDDMAKAGSAR